MKQPLHSILALLLCAAMLLCMLSCKPEDADDPLTEDPSTTTDPSMTDPSTENTSPTDALVLAGAGAANYRVVRGDLESVALRNTMMSLINAIDEKLGVRLTPVTDYEPHDESIKEIVIGYKNNRPCVQGLRESLQENTFSIRVVDGNVIIAGDSDITTAAAVDYFIQTYVSSATDSLTLPKQIDTSMSLMKWQTKNYKNTVTLKTSYSDYIDDYDEELLIAFDAEDTGYTVQMDGYYDEEHSVDGYGALRWDLKGAHEGVNRVLTQGKDTFSFDASDKNRSTLKLWIYVDNTDNIICDHDGAQGKQANQATFFFRAIDKNGKTHSWNHTLTNNGWHEVELSFNIHNGFDKDFDYAHVTSFWFGYGTYGDSTVIIDDMRGVTYATDYTPEAIEGEKNPRLISDCEYNALDGAIIQEWYGTSYDQEDKVQGISSLRNYGDASVNDFRTVVANLDIPMDHGKDALVFHFKVADPMVLKSIFIELNEVQDNHEYSASFTLDALKQYGFGGEKDTWYEIRIPLSIFTVQLNPDIGNTVQLQNFRFVGSASGSGTFDYHIDHIYLAEK